MRREIHLLLTNDIKGEFVIKGEFDLTPGHSEDEIRSELVEVFKTKTPTIRTTDFDFVKREKNVISLPVIKTGFKWDFAHVKNLCGQGRLYVRLNVLKDELLERGNSVLKWTQTVYLGSPVRMDVEDLKPVPQDHLVLQTDQGYLMLNPVVLVVLRMLVHSPGTLCQMLVV